MELHVDTHQMPNFLKRVQLELVEPEYVAGLRQTLLDAFHLNVSFGRIFVYLLVVYLYIFGIFREANTSQTSPMAPNNIFYREHYW